MPRATIEYVARRELAGVEHDDRIVRVTAIDDVQAGTREDCVGPIATLEEIVAGTAPELVVRRAGEDDSGGGTAGLVAGISRAA